NSRSTPSGGACFGGSGKEIYRRRRERPRRHRVATLFRLRQKAGTQQLMSDTSVHGAVDRATDSTAFEYAARAGFAVSGGLHFLIAFIVLRIAFGTGGGNADQSGALGTIAQQPGGKFMLWAAAVGMAALALWHVAEAIVGKHPGERSRSQQDS